MHAQTQATAAGIRVLQIDSSARHTHSITRGLTAATVEALRERHGKLELTYRDLATARLPFVNEAWIDASYTPPAERSATQEDTLAESDALVRELQDADILVLGVPLYNFGIPAALKAWVDLVARAQVTFRYTEKGPEGLLTGRKAYLLTASGGVASESALDFATGYMRHILGFLGITEVEVIAANELMLRPDTPVEQAHNRIRRIGQASPHLDASLPATA